MSRPVSDSQPLASTFPQALSVPLAVDVDGTLLAGNLLHLGLLDLLRRRPLALAGCLWQLRHGRAALKAAVAQQAVIDWERLPLRPQVLAVIQRERAAGRPIVMATAADGAQARALAAACPGLFDEVLASTPTHNLKGLAKARLLSSRWPGGFLYAGDSRADLDVWASAAGGLVVARAGWLWKRAQASARTRQQTLRRLEPDGWRVGEDDGGLAAPRQEVWRFVVSGAAAAGVNLLARLGFSSWLPYPAAVALAYVVAMGVAFVAYRQWVWPASPLSARRQAAGFLMVNLAGGLLVVALASVGRAGAASLAWRGEGADTTAHALALALAAVFNYLAHRRFSFGRSRGGVAVDVPDR